MKKNQHARDLALRFKDLVEIDGDSLPDKHYDELALLIEAGIDTAVVENLERIANELSELSGKIRTNAEFFD
ncbi:MAG: phosphatase [Gammaproteobacteria bacterium]|nr:phosphatase [Gammaproteobacteria bacterium]